MGQGATGSRKLRQRAQAFKKPDIQLVYSLVPSFQGFTLMQPPHCKPQVLALALAQGRAAVTGKQHNSTSAAGWDTGADPKLCSMHLEAKATGQPFHPEQG